MHVYIIQFKELAAFSQKLDLSMLWVNNEISTFNIFIIITYLPGESSSIMDTVTVMKEINTQMKKYMTPFLPTMVKPRPIIIGGLVYLLFQLIRKNRQIKVLYPTDTISGYFSNNWTKVIFESCVIKLFLPRKWFNENSPNLTKFVIMRSV